MNQHKYNIVSFPLVKKENHMSYANISIKKLYAEFVKSLPEGQRVIILLEAIDDSGSIAQISKIHACIREIASEMGQNFRETKVMIKENCGLHFTVKEDTFEKSFGDCSVPELGLAIEAVIEAGDFLGINFRGQFPVYLQDFLRGS
jgi:hypothetical protein